jgi:hypothetical protein
LGFTVDSKGEYWEKRKPVMREDEEDEKYCMQL